MRRAWAVLAVGLALAGCGGSPAGPVVRGTPPAHPYDGPLSVSASRDPHATVLERSGAAGRALECDGKPYAGGYGYYDSGLESVQDTAEAALADYFHEESPQLPREGYRIERSDSGRVLFSYDVGGRSKVTLVTTDSIHDFNGDDGWGVEAWAECDPSELPGEVTDDLDIGVWEDADGDRAPVTSIVSFPGAEHCDWQHVTFLILGSGRRAPEYVRDTTGGELGSFLSTTFSADTALPAGAADIGFSRAGHHLWLSASGDAAYLVGERGTQHAERWPMATQRINCM